MEMLTLEIAKKLKGKTITIETPGYVGQDRKDTFVVGEIKSESKRKETFHLLREDGSETFLRTDKFSRCNRLNEDGSYTMLENLFYGSDSDRFVGFEIAK